MIKTERMGDKYYRSLLEAAVAIDPMLDDKEYELLGLVNQLIVQRAEGLGEVLYELLDDVVDHLAEQGKNEEQITDAVAKIVRDFSLSEADDIAEEGAEKIRKLTGDSKEEVFHLLLTLTLAKIIREQFEGKAREETKKLKEYLKEYQKGE